MKPKQFFLALAGLLGVIVVAGGVGYYFASQYIDAQTSQLSKKLADVDVVATQVDNLAQLAKQYQRIEPTLARLEQVLPRTKNESEIVLQLEKLASNNGMSLPGVTFPASSSLPTSTTQTEKAGDVLAIPVTVQLTGTYDQMQGFLQGLEKLNRFTNVTTLSIAKTDRPRQVSFNLTMQVFLKP